LPNYAQKTWNDNLKEDEMFFIYSDFREGQVALFFSSKALLKNFIKQSNLQPIFLHLDCTFKLIALDLSLMRISTEDINDALRPIAYFITWSGSIEFAKLLLSRLKKFPLKRFIFGSILRTLWLTIQTLLGLLLQTIFLLMNMCSDFTKSKSPLSLPNIV